MLEQSILMILKPLLNTRTIWLIFIEEYNPNKKCTILIVFDDMIADMLSNKNPNQIVTELSIRGIKLNISLIFHSYLLHLLHFSYLLHNLVLLCQKIYNTILTEKQQKYQHYHLEKLINMNILQVKKYYLLIKE